MRPTLIAGLLFSLFAGPIEAANLSARSMSWRGNGSSVSASVLVRNLDKQGGRSGSVRIEMRLSTTPHNVNGRYWTLLMGPSTEGLSGGYERQVNVSGNYKAGSFPPGAYYLIASVQEYNGSGWVIRDSMTSDSKFTIAKPATVLELGQWSWAISKGVASAEVKVTNNGSGERSGGLMLELRLSTAPYGEAGKYWVAAASPWLNPVKGGYFQVFKFSSPFDSLAYQPGEYYVTLVLKENTTDGPVIRRGTTSSSNMTIRR